MSAPDQPLPPPASPSTEIPASPSTENSSSPSAETPPPPFTYHIRRATLDDVGVMSSLASAAYFASAFTDFLNPSRHSYMRDYIYGMEKRARTRLIDPRNISYIAFADNHKPPLAVGYVQFVRLGNDGAAMALGAKQNTWALMLWRLRVYALELWDKLTFVDRSLDLKALAYIMTSDKARWTEDEYQSRFHAQSVVVSPGHQRKGIGKALMKYGLDLAGADGVPLGLEASPEGEMMYRALGFRMRMRFEKKLGGVDGGGIMVWDPPPQGTKSVDSVDSAVPER